MSDEWRVAVSPSSSAGSREGLRGNPVIPCEDMKASPLNPGPSTYQKDRYKGSGTPYRSQVVELKGQAAAGKLPRAVKLLATLRELSLYLSDYEVFDEEYVMLLAGAIPQMKDNDNDNRKALRLLYYHVTEGVTMLVARGQLAPQKLQDIFQLIMNDIGGPASNVSHRHLAVRTAGALAPLASTNGGEQTVRKLTQVLEEPMLKLAGLANSTRPQTKKKSALKEYQDQCFISSAYACCLRRFSVCPPSWLAHTLALCCMDNDDTARHAFAALPRFIADDVESVALGLHKKLRPTNSEYGAMFLNVRDPLACIYYLRVCRILAFHPTTMKINESIREEFYRTIVKSISDTRLRVSLEAIRCLFSNGLESYNRIVAMESKSHMSLVNQSVSTLVTAIAPYQNPEGSLSPALHSILRVVLLVATTLRQGVQAAIAAANAEPAPELPTPRSLNDTMAFLDIFHRPAPITPASNLIMQPPPPLPYQEEMKNLVRVIHSAGFLECKSPYISTTGLCAVMWLAPNPDSAPMMASAPRQGMDNPEDAWRTIHRLALKAVRYCPDDLLREILDVLQARAELQPALAPTLLPMIFNIAEHFFHKAPCDAMGALILQTWQAILDHHHTVAPSLVLESAFRILDYNHGQANNAVIKNNPAGGDSMGRAASVWAIHGAEAPSLSQARSAHTRVKRLAAWFLGQYITKLMPEQLPAVFMRLKTLAIFGDYHTRCVAVTALCKAALVLESLDLKMDVYEFLHSLEVAEFDLSICPDVKEEMTSLSEVQGHAIDYLDQGGGLCLKDIISPVMACLDKHFEAVYAGRDTTTLPLDRTLKDLLTIQDND